METMRAHATSPLSLVCVAFLVKRYIAVSASQFLQTSVGADYVFSIQLVSFSNPNNTLANGSCCVCCEQTGNCSTPCDASLQICLINNASNPSDVPNCPLPNIGLNALPRGLNPVVDGPWPGAVLSQITAFNDDAEQIIDVISVHVSLLVMPSDPFTAPQNFLGVNGMATLELRFQITCAVRTGFYGMDCNTFCLDTNDTTGHYTCDQDGMRVCLDGYLNPATNCTECIPAEGCSPVGGFCTSPGECLCRSNYFGENCSMVVEPSISPTSQFPLPTSDDSTAPSSDATSPAPSEAPGSAMGGGSGDGQDNDIDDTIVLIAAVVGAAGGLLLLIAIVVTILILVLIARKKRKEKCATSTIASDECFLRNPSYQPNDEFIRQPPQGAEQPTSVHEDYVQMNQSSVEGAAVCHSLTTAKNHHVGHDNGENDCRNGVDLDPKDQPQAAAVTVEYAVVRKRPKNQMKGAKIISDDDNQAARGNQEMKVQVRRSTTTPDSDYETPLVRKEEHPYDMPPLSPTNIKSGQDFEHTYDELSPANIRIGGKGSEHPYDMPPLSPTNTKGGQDFEHTYDELSPANIRIGGKGSEHPYDMPPLSPTNTKGGQDFEHTYDELSPANIRIGGKVSDHDYAVPPSPSPTNMWHEHSFLLPSASKHYIAIGNFIPEAGDERGMELQEGQEVEVMGTSERGWWWVRTTRSTTGVMEEGWVPSAFLCPLKI